MIDINQTLAALRIKYPEDISKIEEEEKHLQQLLDGHEYYMHPGTQKLIAKCRNEVKTARLKLATDKNLSDPERQALWFIIEGRQWFLHLVVKDYEAELTTLAEELSTELERTL